MAKNFLGVVCATRKYLRTILGKETSTTFGKILIDNGVHGYSQGVIFETVGYLSDADQRRLGKLFCEYLEGYSVKVYDKYAILLSAVQSYCSMKPPYKQEEFDRLMNFYKNGN